MQGQFKVHRNSKESIARLWGYAWVSNSNLDTISQADETEVPTREAPGQSATGEPETECNRDP